MCINQGFAFCIAQETEKGAAIHPLKGFFHILAGYDAAVVLAQYYLDRPAQIRDQVDALTADNQQYCQQSAKAYGYFSAKIEHTKPPFSAS
jgi:hypothetical protein